MKLTLGLILLVGILMELCQSKVIRTSLPYHKFKKGLNSIYITKFSLDIGSGSFKSRMKFNKPLIQTNRTENTTLSIDVVLDDKWEQYQNAETCQEKKNNTRVASTFYVPNDGSNWSNEITHILTQIVRRRTYYFVLLDCDGNLNGKNPVGLKFDIEATMLNVDESHFSSEEEGFLTPFFLILVACSAFFGKNLERLLKQYKKEEELDWAFTLANITLLLFTIQILFEWIHMLIYSSNGSGSFILQMFGQIFGIAAQFIMAIIFILISWGWTINYSDLENYDIYIPLAALIGIVHMMIVGLSKLSDDESNKFHQYGGFVGWVIVFLRVGMYIYFLFGIRDTLKTAREKVKIFIYKFTVFGSLYFLAFPIILFISTFIASYVQNRVITIGTLLMQALSIIFMSFQFTSKSSQYYQASMKANPLLPFGKED